MQRNYRVGTILIAISMLISQQSCVLATPADKRLARQTKGSSNEGSGTPQEERKILSGQVTVNPPQLLPNFSGAVGGAGLIPSIPFGGHYGGINLGGSGYPGTPGMGLLSLQLGNAPSGGLNGLQLGKPTSGLGYPNVGSYVGNNLPPYQLNNPDAYTNYLFNGLPQVQSSYGPTASGAQIVDNYMHAANLQGAAGVAGVAGVAGGAGVAGAGGSQMPILGPQGAVHGQLQGNLHGHLQGQLHAQQQAQLQAQQQAQLQAQLQGQASQLHPQLAAPFPYGQTFYGQLSGYGPAFRGYQLL